MKRSFATSLGALLSMIVCGELAFADDVRGSHDNHVQAAHGIISTSWNLRGSVVSKPIHGSTTPISNKSLYKFLRGSLEQSKSLRASVHDYNAALYGEKTASARLLPKVSFEFDYGRRDETSTIFSSDETEYQTSSLSLEWPVFRSGAGIAEIKAARFAAEAARYRVINDERQQVLESLGIYLQLLGASKQVEYLAKSRSSLKSVLHGTRKRYRAGFASQTDIAEVSNEIAAIDIQLEQFRLSAKEQRIRWHAATGTKARKQLDWPDIAKLIPATSAETVQKALQDNPIVGISDNEAISQENRAKAEMAGFLPRVDIYAEYSQDHGRTVTGGDDYDYEVGARLTVPLIDFAATSRYRQSTETALAARYRAIDTEHQMRRDIEAAWHGLQSSRRQDKLIRKRIGLSKQIRTGLIREYEAGLRPVSDYLIQEVELARLRQELVVNQINTITIAWQIAMQFGSITLSDLTH